MSNRNIAPIVDVLLPAYNCAETIVASVRSILGQSMPALRLIVIDDGSTDGTGDIVGRLALEDRRISLLRQPNSGIVDALNRGLACATAPFVARQDGDDISSPDRLARQLAVLERHADVVAISGSCEHIDAAGRRLGSRYVVCDPELADMRAVPSVEPYLLHPFLLLRRRALEAVGGYRHVFHAEDTDLYWRLHRVGRLRNMDESLGLMRLHQGSVTNASIVNGRISAIHSQLAAISAQRVAAGRPDLEFPSTALPHYRQSRELSAMLELAGRQLDEEERGYLRVAASAKLLELATGRAYELELDDCRLIRRAYREMPSPVFRGPSTAGWAYRASLKRLVRRGDLEKLRALLSLSVISRSAWLRFQ